MIILSFWKFAFRMNWAELIEYFNQVALFPVPVDSSNSQHSARSRLLFYPGRSHDKQQYRAVFCVYLWTSQAMTIRAVNHARSPVAPFAIRQNSLRRFDSLRHLCPPSKDKKITALWPLPVTIAPKNCLDLIAHFFI